MVEDRTSINRETRSFIFFTSVVAVLVYFLAPVNVPFHRNRSKIKNLPRKMPIEKMNFFVDFLLSTDHLRRSMSRHEFIRGKTFSIRHSCLSFFFLFILSIFPLTLTSSTNSSIFFFGELPLNSSSVSLTHRSKMPLTWNVACCKENRSKMLHCNYSIFANELDFKLIQHTKVDHYEFLYDEDLFCQRYGAFRHLSLHYLAIFTYIIVIVGIILNIFVFLVLICGSLRRSTSFVLFLALTVFDLLSLASSLFASLFRTVMAYLKTSAPFCKMFGIFFLFFRQCSSTTLLLIAVERCIVIKYPFCRDTFDRLRVPLLVLIMLIFVAPIPFDFAFYTSGPLHCEAVNTIQADRYQVFRGFFTVLSYAIVPFVGISISNLLIIIELKQSKKRFTIKDKNGTKTRFSTNVVDKRGTTVMLLVASIAFLLLLGPFYIHWCVTYLFYNYSQCHFTRNLYENVQVCMGVFNPYLTVIEKGMRDSNHAINFLLYWATSTRFRKDFKRLSHQLIYRICGSAILFLYKHICFFCPEPSCLTTLERHVSDTTEQESSLESNRKNQTAYKTAHYYSNYERRRQQHLVRTSLMSTDETTTMAMSSLSNLTGKTVRTLTVNHHDPIVRQINHERLSISENC